MNYTKQEIKKGINLHLIKTNKFKTNLIAIFLTTPLERDNVTINSLIPAVLSRGSKNMQTADLISKELEEMYGAYFDCGIDKTGDNQILKFYLESINDEFLPQKENLLEKSISHLIEIVFEPYMENGSFKTEYVDGEKSNLKQIIEGKIDNKANYALIRCIEEMYKNEPYGLYKYGYVEDLEKITKDNLKQRYDELIANCKIDIFVSGVIEEDISNLVKNRLNTINEREPNYIASGKLTKKENKEINEVAEEMDIAQGKLVMGLNVAAENKKEKYTALVYNAIFGGVPTSKLFQNVREKASLAYTASSSYLRQKNNIFVKCGIEVENYDKAIKIIKEQMEDMKLRKIF